MSLTTSIANIYSGRSTTTRIKKLQTKYACFNHYMYNNQLGKTKFVKF